jgi:hypothetical protein
MRCSRSHTAKNSASGFGDEASNPHSSPHPGIPTEPDSARSFATAAHLGYDSCHLAVKKTMKVDITSMPIDETPRDFSEGLMDQGDPVG